MRQLLAAFVLVLPAPAVAGESSETDPTVEERLARLEKENAELEQRLARIGTARPAPHLTLLGDVHLRFNGYLDAGFFDASGDGVAYVRDVGKVAHPEFSDVPWVFLGDPWANPVNSQGDPADLGLDRTNLDRFDPIGSQGRPSFAVSTMSIGLVGSLSRSLLVESSFELEPRRGHLGSSGDQVNVDLAYAEWIPREDLDLHVFVGKFESTFGIEYRGRKAPDRFGITPSIISRYTSGTPTGIKVRGGFFADSLVTYNVALTNGGTFTEKFAHFHADLDSNSGKTVSGRLALRAPVPFFLEAGGSGAWGAQDLQPSSNIVAWQYGGDFKLAVSDLTIRGEYLRAVSQGGGTANAPWLRVEGWYAEGTYQLTPWMGLLVRADYRHARLFADPNLYITDTGRLTGGLRFDVNLNMILKVEYLRIDELSGPEIDDDVLTSSFLFRF